MPYQSLCFAVWTAELRNIRQANKRLHKAKDAALPLHPSTAVTVSLGPFLQPRCKGRKGNRVISGLLP